MLAIFDVSVSVGCKNNDRTVSNQSYAWRVLGMMPSIDPDAVISACVKDAKWLTQRSARLYHGCIAHVVKGINEFCAQDRYLRFADKKVSTLQ